MAGPTITKSGVDPAALRNPSWGIAGVPVVFTGGFDVDFTITASTGSLNTGSTGGYCPRWLKVGATGGTVIYYNPDGTGPYTYTAAASEMIEWPVSYLSASSTATPLTAIR